MKIRVNRGEIDVAGADIVRQETTAVVTGADSHTTKFVIHAAVTGQELHTDELKIRTAARSAPAAAGKLAVESVSFPAPGAGAGGFDIHHCARILIGERQR